MGTGERVTHASRILHVANTAQRSARCDPRAPSQLISEHLNDFGHDLELTFAVVCEHDWPKIGIDGLEVDPGVAPGVAVPGLLALVRL